MVEDFAPQLKKSRDPSTKETESDQFGNVNARISIWVLVFIVFCVVVTATLYVAGLRRQAVRVPETTLEPTPTTTGQLRIYPESTTPDVRETPGWKVYQNTAPTTPLSQPQNATTTRFALL